MSKWITHSCIFKNYIHVPYTWNKYNALKLFTLGLTKPKYYSIKKLTLHRVQGHSESY